jgi:hypothetical protein
MLVMEELQKTYTVASIYRGIFAKAIQQLFPEYTEGTLLGHSTPAVSHNHNTATHAIGATEEATEVASGVDGLGYNNVAADDFIDLLMDEASIFNFWDTWNRE